MSILSKFYANLMSILCQNAFTKSAFFYVEKIAGLVKRYIPNLIAAGTWKWVHSGRRWSVQRGLGPLTMTCRAETILPPTRATLNIESIISLKRRRRCWCLDFRAKHSIFLPSLLSQPGMHKNCRRALCSVGRLNFARARKQALRAKAPKGRQARRE